MSDMPVAAKVSHGFSRRRLEQECALRFDMTPASTHAVARELFDLGAISDPRTYDRYFNEDYHEEGAKTLAALAAISPEWKALVENTDGSYLSSVWQPDDFFADVGAIRPHPTTRFAEFTPDQRNVFSVVAERYIALFDRSRSTTQSDDHDTCDEMRLFKAQSHVKVVEVFGQGTQVVGPDFFVDKQIGSLFVAVNDSVTGDSWLEVPLGAVLAVMEEFPYRDNGDLFPYQAIIDFARSNMPLLQRFVDEVNNTVFPQGRGLYVCAPDTFELRDGQRYYMWPRQ